MGYGCADQTHSCTDREQDLQRDAEPLPPTPLLCALLAPRTLCLSGYAPCTSRAAGWRRSWLGRPMVVSPGVEGGWTWWGPEGRGGDPVFTKGGPGRGWPFSWPPWSWGFSVALERMLHRRRAQRPHIWDSGCPGSSKPGVTAILVNNSLCVPGLGAGQAGRLLPLGPCGQGLLPFPLIR